MASVVWVMSVVTALLLSTITALVYSIKPADMAGHFSRMLMFFVILSVGAIVTNRDPRLGIPSNLDKLIRQIAFCTMLLKIGILSGVLFGWFSFADATEAFGFESVTDNIGLNLQRLQFPSDIVIVFLLSCYRGGRRFIDLAFMGCVSVIVYLSFSRFLFGAFALALAVRALWVRRVDMTLIGSVLIAVAAVSVFAVNLASRFSGDGSSRSDNTRTEQMQVLAESFVDHPILGVGLGGSVHGHLRSQRQPYFYEVQWYAMAMQFGVVGLTWLALNFLALFLVNVQNQRNRIYAFAVAIIWALSGFTNPFLTSVGSAFGLCLLLIRSSNRRPL